MSAHRAALEHMLTVIAESHRSLFGRLLGPTAGGRLRYQVARLARPVVHAISVRLTTRVDQAL
jgi:hypothetical protein